MSGYILKHSLSPSKDKLLSFEVMGHHRCAARFEDTPNCQPQERCDVAFDKKNEFGSLPAENIFCKVECPQSNREISTPFKIGKGGMVLVKLTLSTHRY